MLRRRDVQRLAVIGGFAQPLAAGHDVDAVIAEDALQQHDVGEPRHVVEDQRLLGQEARDHQGQRGVLGAGNRNGAVQRPAADNTNAIHYAPLRPAPGRPVPPNSGPGLRRKSGSPCLRPASCAARSSPACCACRPRACSLRRLRFSRSAAAAAPDGLPIAPLCRACSWPACQSTRPTRPQPGFPAAALAPESALWQGSPRFVSPICLRFCCRSSVVEHSLGKGEVHSSILCGSTILEQAERKSCDVICIRLGLGPIRNVKQRRTCSRHHRA